MPAKRLRLFPGFGIGVDLSAFAFGHLALDAGLVAVTAGQRAIRPVRRSLEPLTLALGGGALAFVRERLSSICQLLAPVCDAVPLVSDPLAIVCQPLSPVQVRPAALEGVLLRVELGGPPLQLSLPIVECTGVAGIVVSIDRYLRAPFNANTSGPPAARDEVPFRCFVSRTGSSCHGPFRRTKRKQPRRTSTDTLRAMRSQKK